MSEDDTYVSECILNAVPGDSIKLDFFPPTMESLFGYKTCLSLLRNCHGRLWHFAPTVEKSREILTSLEALSGVKQANFLTVFPKELTLYVISRFGPVEIAAIHDCLLPLVDGCYYIPAA